MDKKILNSLSTLYKVNDKFYEDKDITLEKHKEIAEYLNRLENCLLEIDKKYDAKKHKREKMVA